MQGDDQALVYAVQVAQHVITPSASRAWGQPGVPPTVSMSLAPHTTTRALRFLSHKLALISSPKLVSMREPCTAERGGP